MNEQYLSRDELLGALGVGYPLFRKWRNQGGPSPKGKGKNSAWPLYAWCEWIIQRPFRPNQDRGVIQKAAEILRNRDGALTPEVVEPVSRETSGEGVGLEAALERLRQAERATFGRWQQAFNDDRKEAPMFFKDWQMALDLLRKAEKNLTDHLVQRRDLLPASEVKAWMATMITEAKQTLLNIPGKLAPQLENQPWPKIQKRLEEEIRFALEKISNSPG